jgi:hypothetical protein
MTAHVVDLRVLSTIMAISNCLIYSF